MSIAPEATSHDRSQGMPSRSQRGDLTWEMVTMFPHQGDWTESDYLSREFDGLVEYSNGVLEFLPMPSLFHQFLVDYLHSHLKEFVKSRSLGFTAFAPVRVRVGERLYREPDIVFVKRDRIQGLDQPLDGADLVMEVVSDSSEDRHRDFVTKRAEYAAASIPEYWIIDPSTETVYVLVLQGQEYGIHGEFKSGTVATSVLLPGFEVVVKSCFDSVRRMPD